MDQSAELTQALRANDLEGVDSQLQVISHSMSPDAAFIVGYLGCYVGYLHLTEWCASESPELWDGGPRELLALSQRRLEKDITFLGDFFTLLKGLGEGRLSGNDHARVEAFAHRVLITASAEALVRRISNEPPL